MAPKDGQVPLNAAKLSKIAPKMIQHAPKQQTKFLNSLIWHLIIQIIPNCHQHFAKELSKCFKYLTSAMGKDRDKDTLSIQYALWDFKDLTVFLCHGAS